MVHVPLWYRYLNYRTYSVEKEGISKYLSVCPFLWTYVSTDTKMILRTYRITILSKIKLDNGYEFSLFQTRYGTILESSSIAINLCWRNIEKLNKRNIEKNPCKKRREIAMKWFLIFFLKKFYFSKIVTKKNSSILTD